MDGPVRRPTRSHHHRGGPHNTERKHPLLLCGLGVVMAMVLLSMFTTTRESSRGEGGWGLLAPSSRGGKTGHLASSDDDGKSSTPSSSHNHKRDPNDHEVKQEYHAKVKAEASFRSVLEAIQHKDLAQNPPKFTTHSALTGGGGGGNEGHAGGEEHHHGGATFPTISKGDDIQMKPESIQLIEGMSLPEAKLLLHIEPPHEAHEAAAATWTNELQRAEKKIPKQRPPPANEKKGPPHHHHRVASSMRLGVAVFGTIGVELRHDKRSATNQQQQQQSSGLPHSMRFRLSQLRSIRNKLLLPADHVSSLHIVGAAAAATTMSESTTTTSSAAIVADCNAMVGIFSPLFLTSIEVWDAASIATAINRKAQTILPEKLQSELLQSDNVHHHLFSVDSVRDALRNDIGEPGYDEIPLDLVDTDEAEISSLSSSGMNGAAAAVDEETLRRRVTAKFNTEHPLVRVLMQSAAVQRVMGTPSQQQGIDRDSSSPPDYYVAVRLDAYLYAPLQFTILPERDQPAIVFAPSSSSSSSSGAADIGNETTKAKQLFTVAELNIPRDHSPNSQFSVAVEEGPLNILRHFTDFGDLMGAQLMGDTKEVTGSHAENHDDEHTSDDGNNNNNSTTQRGQQEDGGGFAHVRSSRLFMKKRLLRLAKEQHALSHSKRGGDGVVIPANFGRDADGGGDSHHLAFGNSNQEDNKHILFKESESAEDSTTFQPTLDRILRHPRYALRNRYPVLSTSTASHAHSEPKKENEVPPPPQLVVSVHGSTSIGDGNTLETFIVAGNREGMDVLSGQGAFALGYLRYVAHLYDKQRSGRGYTKHHNTEQHEPPARMALARWLTVSSSRLFAYYLERLTSSKQTTGRCVASIAAAKTMKTGGSLSEVGAFYNTKTFNAEHLQSVVLERTTEKLSRAEQIKRDAEGGVGDGDKDQQSVHTEGVLGLKTVGCPIVAYFDFHALPIDLTDKRAAVLQTTLADGSRTVYGASTRSDMQPENLYCYQYKYRSSDKSKFISTNDQEGAAGFVALKRVDMEECEPTFEYKQQEEKVAKRGRGDRKKMKDAHQLVTKEMLVFSRMRNVQFRCHTFVKDFGTEVALFPNTLAARRGTCMSEDAHLPSLMRAVWGSTSRDARPTVVVQSAGQKRNGGGSASANGNNKNTIKKQVTTFVNPFRGAMRCAMCEQRDLGSVLIHKLEAEAEELAAIEREHL